MRLSKIELKKELKKIGIPVVGNYIRKKDLLKVIKASNTSLDIKGVKFYIEDDGADRYVEVESSSSSTSFLDDEKMREKTENFLDLRDAVSVEDIERGVVTPVMKKRVSDTLSDYEK